MAPVPPTLIRTDHLVLRPWSPDDVDALSVAITASVDHLRPWMPWAGAEPLPRAERSGVVERFVAQWETGEDFVYGAFLADEPIGGAGLHPRIGSGGFEIGYWIHVDHTGRGYATEAAGALAVAALALDGIDRVEIHHDAANRASARVPAKLGFRRVGERRRQPSAPAETGVNVIWRSP